jgi:formate dehydrogenase subunit delta
MANQIAQFFATQKTADVAADVADHLKKFWEPRMRAQICAHLASGGEGLVPAARAAVAMLATERKAQAN